jgi:nucleotide-binding universal stress UspA family protein
MKILCATDFSEAGQAAEEMAITLTRALGGELVYVHVNVETPPLYGEAVFAAAEVERVYESERRWAEAELARHVAAVAQRGIKARSVLRTGVAVEQILAAAEEERADMLVMGTHGRTGLDRLLMGSVAERVVRTATCPVLTVRPRPSEEKRAAAA